MPPDLLKEIRKTAKETGLSLADVMRQSMKLGVPSLRKGLGRKSPILKGLKPFTKKEARECWGKPNPEFDQIEHDMASRPMQEPKDD